MDSQPGIPQDGLRAGGRDRNIISLGVSQHVLEVIQGARLFRIFHL
jgi:hypothetical protein